MRVGRLLLALCWWMVAVAGWAAVPADDLSFARRRWTLADGAPGQSFDLAQTSDGLMWFTSPSGLYSFDGIKFRQETAIYGEPLLSPNTSSLHALPNGALAVGYSFGGLSIFSPQGARHFEAGKGFPLGSTRAIASGPDGMLYACTTTGVFVLQNGAWVAIGHDDWSAPALYKISFDREGTLWALGDEGVYARPTGRPDLRFVAKSKGRGFVNMFQRWLHLRLPDGQFVRLHGSGLREAIKVENAASFNSLADGPNGTEVALRDGGVVRLAQRPDGVWYEAEFYPPVYGAGTGGMGLSYLVDREGNFWHTTHEGVEKMRLHRFHQLRRQDQLWLVHRGLGDEVWAGGYTKKLVRLKPDGSEQETSMSYPTSVLRVAADRVWAATREGLWQFAQGTQRRWDGPGLPGSVFEAQSMVLDADGVLLIAIPRRGLWRFENGAWRQDARLKAQQDPTPIAMLRTAHGQTWVALTNNRVGVVTPESLKLLPAGSNLRIGNTLSMLDAGGRLLIGGDMGIAWIDGDKVHEMTFQHRGNVLRVTGLVIDNLGQLWIHCNDGLLLVPAQELADFWHAPGQPVRTELFNFEDGVSGTASMVRPLPSLSVDGAGRVFYATTSQVGWIDPAHIRRNTHAPDLIIQSLRTAAGELRAIDGMTLPGHPTAVDLTFTATALSVPERVRLKYRLEGVDADWQDVQRERNAHYTNLAPGRYRFQVIAANEDGVWNRQGAELHFDILPAFWQTPWFRLLCLLALMLVCALLYRWRIAVVRRRAELLADERAQARLEATLQERSRIARSLHDNLLQAVQALILRFHSVQTRMPQEPELQARLDRVLTYAEELVESTRDEVVALRRDPSCEELFVELHKSLADAMPGAEALLVCTTSGPRKSLRDQVAGELLYVLREAVWNSAKHAQASRIAVTLCFSDQALEGEVVDDGIGISAEHAADGAAGHWGIVGMRERIERLGGTLTIAAAAPRGVTVRFTLPAQRAYRG